MRCTPLIHGMISPLSITRNSALCFRREYMSLKKNVSRPGPKLSFFSQVTGNILSWPYICDIWCVYIDLAGLLIVVLLWVLFTNVTYVVIATNAG